MLKSNLDLKLRVEKGSKIQISGGLPILAQIIVICFFGPFLLCLFYLIVMKNPSVGGVLFFLGSTFVAGILIKNVMSYADISLVNKVIVVRKIFWVRYIKPEEFRSVNRGLLPFTFYVQFTDLKVYFFLNESKVVADLMKGSEQTRIELEKVFLKLKDG
jgi:hypothetical protein